MTKQYHVPGLVHDVSTGYIQRNKLRRKRNKGIRRTPEQFGICDHIFLFADNLETLHKMIEELQKENIKAGLNINIAKTEIIANKCINDTWKITINDEETKKTQ